MTTSPRLLIATYNPGKARELASLLGARPEPAEGEAPYAITTPQQEGLALEVQETGATLEENATLKARAFARASGLLTLADDSGLEVEALGGEPGAYSSRYAGPGAGDPERVQYLLDKLQGVPPEARRARFRCVIAIAGPEGAVRLFQGQVEGRIALEPRGGNGFGYDPVFLLPELGRTMAELSPEEKNRVSHRGRAARQAAEALRRMAGAGPAWPSVEHMGLP